MKKRFLLPCECGRKLVVEAAQAGEQLRCECGATRFVPTLRGLSDLEPAPEPAAAAPVPGRAVKFDVAFAASFFVLIGSLVALVPLVIIWWGLDTSFNIDSDVTYGNQQIDQMPIEHTWEIWKELQKSGLQPREVPFYTKILQYSTVFGRIIIGLSALAMLSVLGLVVSGVKSAKVRAARKASLSS